MRRRKQLAVLTASIAVLGCLIYLVLAVHREVSAIGLARLQFDVGERATYRVDWDVTTGAAVAPQQAAGLGSQLQLTSRISGTVTIETLSVARDEATLAIAFGDLEDFSFTMAGQNAVRDHAETEGALRGKRAFVTMTTRGEIRSIAFEDTTEVGARNALRGLVMQMQLSLPAEARETWHADESVAVGRMTFNYRGGATSLTRTPHALVRLDAAPGTLDGTQAVTGNAAFSLTAGKLVAIDDRETWSYVRAGASTPAVSHASTFKLRRIATARFDPSTVSRPQLPGQPLGETVADADQDRRFDIALAREMSQEKLVSGIEHFEAGQKVAHDFVARAAAFLRLHPDHARTLALEFVRKDMTTRGRGLILDVLASAGDANAQAAMRTLLGTPAAHEAASRFGVLVQRFTFVKKPDEPSVAFLADIVTNPDAGLGDVQGAATSLGAVAHRLARDGQTERAQRATDLIAARLEATASLDETRALLAGLGNAGDARHLEQVKSFSTHDDPRVRAEVASALGTIRTDAARASLIELATDRDAAVGVLVFQSLGKHQLRDSDWSKLADAARAKQTSASADGSFVELVRAKRESAGAHGIEILQALQSRNVGEDNDLARVIGDLLAQR